MSEEVLAAKLAEMDTNSDGVVSREEFEAFTEKLRASADANGPDRDRDDFDQLLLQ